MKRVFTTILVFLGLLTVGVTVGVNAASDTLTKDGKAYNLVQTTEDLVDGNYIISYNGTNFMGALGSGIFTSVTVENAIVWKITTAAEGKKTIQNPTTLKYVGNNGTKNKANEYALDDVGAHIYWNISITNSVAVLENPDETTYKKLQYNTGSPRFACYNGTQKDLSLYLEQASDPEATYYDITFDAQNSTENKVIQVKENDLLVAPTTPVKEGFIFKGWYKESTCENLFNFETEVATGAMTLYAGWDVDPYSYATINSDNFKPLTTGSGYVPYNGSHILKNLDDAKNEFSYTTYQVMVQSGMIQFQKEAGYLYNGSTVKGNISSIKVENLTGELTIYTSNSVIENVTDLTGTTLTADNSVYEVPEGVEHTYFYIKVSGTALAKASAITIQYTYDESFAKYSVRFNAGKGVFKEGKGVTLSELEGVSLTGNLPTTSDLEMTAYKYTNLIGWNDGVKTYAPGEAFEVNSLTVFNAIYEVPENITVDQAKEIAVLAGTTKTSYKFSCMGIVSSIEKVNEKTIQFTLKDLASEETISVYNSKLNGMIYVGDKITVTGSLSNFNSLTLQFMDDSSYVINDNLISSFIRTETKSSLKAQYDGNFMPVDVDFRFGAKIALNSYNENATYGVMAIDNATFAGFVAGKTEYATADEFIAANAGVKKMACPNGALLEDGYQFAWVMTDMEGHYKTYFTAVIYMEYDGVLYLGVSKIKSVAQQASRYIEDHNNPENTEVNLTEEQLRVLQNIISKEA